MFAFPSVRLTKALQNDIIRKHVCAVRSTPQLIFCRTAAASPQSAAVTAENLRREAETQGEVGKALQRMAPLGSHLDLVAIHTLCFKKSNLL